MVSVGYMAKAVVVRPEWVTANVIDIYSVSGCISANFMDYFQFWKHNGYWFFNTPDVIVELARTNGIDTAGLKWFYYEVYEKQFDDLAKAWVDFRPRPRSLPRC